MNGPGELLIERSSLIEFEQAGIAEAHLERYVAMGANAGVAVGDTALGGAGRVKAARTRVAEGGGRLVGRVVNILIKRTTHETRDPWRKHRQDALEQAQPSLSSQYPELAHALLDASEIASPAAAPPIELTVLAHETVSSGMRMAAALFGSAPPMPGLGPIVRYEHAAVTVVLAGSCPRGGCCVGPYGGREVTSGP